MYHGVPMLALWGTLPGNGALWAVFAVLVFVFELWMLIDCVTSRMKNDKKLLWCFLILVFPLIGSVLYLFVARGRSFTTLG
ncbi:MAG TPA: PLD nuclease N-terminal domain-containing protein [Tepidisphaeraceae bacterium]|nr:PLD nuclease N-terminal domain-containing protein [Tepidisphaeraceae bacterium]